MSIHGIHDDEWCREMHRRFPKSLVFKAWAKPESLTEQEMFRAVSITGDANIALKWKEANMDDKKDKSLMRGILQNKEDHVVGTVQIPNLTDRPRKKGR